MKWIECVTAERDKSHPFYSSRYYLVDGKVFGEKRIPIWRNNKVNVVYTYFSIAMNVMTPSNSAYVACF